MRKEGNNLNKITFNQLIKVMLESIAWNFFTSHPKFPNLAIFGGNDLFHVIYSLDDSLSSNLTGNLLQW